MVKKSPFLFCFVVMPFDQEYRGVYDHGIVPAVRKVANKVKRRPKCQRTDDISKSSSITRDIVEAICNADIIVADLTGNNPNVFYELGIAHSIGNKTVMITRDIKTVPFDLKTYRIIAYETVDLRFRKLQQNLIRSMEQMLITADMPSNPVQDYAPIKHNELICGLSEILNIENRVRKEIWIIGPNVDIDIQLYTDVIRENILHRRITYKYILPKTQIAMMSWGRLQSLLKIPQGLASLLQVQYVKEHEIESEIVLYDPYTNDERVYLMPPTEEKYHFYFRIRGSRAISIRKRFEKLWKP